MANDRVRLPHVKIAPELAAALDQRRAKARVANQPQAARAESAALTPGQEACPATGAPGAPGPDTLDIIISVKPDPANPQGGVKGGKDSVKAQLAHDFPGLGIDESDFFLRCHVTPEQVETISRYPSVDVLWRNPEIEAHLLTSVETVRASAGWRTFEARGKGITWAVLDTGINAKHPHFANLNTVDAALSKSFVPGGDPLTDPNGHGTHVAGIIAGMAPATKQDDNSKIDYFAQSEQTAGADVPPQELDGPPAGMAPAARLISIQVLRRDGGGTAFDAIRALEYLRTLNEGSRDRLVDGANLSFGYDLEAMTYGCGFSPICEEVDRVVESGICVVVSCGNAGYGTAQSEAAGSAQPAHVGLSVSISDPANAKNCIAVGSVHKREPHKYGVSYFSSKGPTLDGRQKPDMVAPGERIISCNASYDPTAAAPVPQYCEMSGTSMAAPHVSGAIASFLSVRPDYRGNPGDIKEIFMKAALDLGRSCAYQGSGMVDVFKALTTA